jgi:hypothetical protein
VARFIYESLYATRAMSSLPVISRASSVESSYRIYRCTPLPLLDMYVRKSGLRYQWQPSSLRAISGTVEVKWEVSRDSRVPRHHLCIVHGTVRYGALRYAASCCPLMPLSASVVSA